MISAMISLDSSQPSCSPRSERDLHRADTDRKRPQNPNQSKTQVAIRFGLIHEDQEAKHGDDAETAD